MKINTLKRSILVALISLTFCLKAEGEIRVFKQKELQGFLENNTTLIDHTTCSKNGTTESSISETGKNLDQKCSDFCPQLGNKDNARIFVTGYTENQNNSYEADKKGCESVAGIELEKKTDQGLYIKPFVKGRGVVIIFPYMFSAIEGNFLKNDGEYYYFTKDNYQGRESFTIKEERDLVLLINGTYSGYLSPDFLYICVRLLFKYPNISHNNGAVRSVDNSTANQSLTEELKKLVDQYVNILTEINREDALKHFLVHTIVIGIAYNIYMSYNLESLFKVPSSNNLLDKFEKKEQEKVKKKLQPVAAILNDIFCNEQSWRFIKTTHRRKIYIVKNKMEKICERFKKFYSWWEKTRIVSYEEDRAILVLGLLTNLNKSFENTAVFSKIFNEKLAGLSTKTQWWNALERNITVSLKMIKECLLPVSEEDKDTKCLNLVRDNCNFFDFMINSLNEDPKKDITQLCFGEFHPKLNYTADTDMPSSDIETELKKILEYAKSEIEKPENKRDYPTTPLGLQELLSTDTASVVPNNNEGSNESNNNSIINKPLNLLRIIL